MIFQRAWLFRLLACAAALCGSFCVMQTSAGQDATAAWNAVNQAPFNAVTAAHVENLTLVRDRIRITLVDGTLQFTQPANGFVFGAAFTGRGRIEITPPNPTEAQQLQLFAKVPTLNADFDQATVSFTDGTFDEVAKEVKWTSAGDNSLADLYQKRQRTREDLAAEIVPRIFEGVLSGDHQRTAYFAAELKTSNDGWILAKYDALEPEEISVGRYASRGTPAMLFDTWMSFPAGGANASQVFQEPLKKDVFLAHGYQIDATVTGGADLSATTKVNLQYQATGERVLVFSFSANLRVSSVKDEGEQRCRFFSPGSQTIDFRPMAITLRWCCLSQRRRDKRQRLPSNMKEST